MKAFLLATFLLLCSCAEPRAISEAQPSPFEQPRHEFVLMVSVDGLRSDALTTLPPGELPAIERLFTGAFTLEARTDPELTVTLPNHVGMLTGRFYGGPQGHHWRRNHTAPQKETLHSVRGNFTSGVFHVAQACGIQTGMVAAKEKFQVFPISWNLPRDEPVLNQYNFEPDALLGALKVVDFFKEQKGHGALAFWHLRDLDVAGHGEGQGWSLNPESEYMQALQTVDLALGVLFAYLDSHPEVLSRTAILLTSDHGGGVPLHGHWIEGLHPENWTIPLLAWSGRGAFSGELYELNTQTRLHPGLAIATPNGSLPAIANADIGNLALHILGLPPIPGSVSNKAQNLRLVERN
ncbi:MAG: alkaline phosphatase family protein [Planctomycetota bacterium]|nr:alkaline phosphatase family protein [Planctomycetota bacterium]MDP6941620.1 alkaline phosphatase family protein [Planctomycetota bacterium]